MNIFEHATTSTKQGDVGEARAIYEYTRLGYSVMKPLNDSSKYDLVVEKDGELKRIQVKTTRYKEGGSYKVMLSTQGGNQSYSTIRTRQDGDYDELFALAETGECWMIPVSLIGRKGVAVGSKKFDEYKIEYG